MKKLPIGVSTFKEIRQEYGYYVDKTALVKQLVDHGKYFFLSRPRRFGKSLFVDTLKQAFLGEQEYFKGLFLESHWDWTKKYPVIHFSFGTGEIKSRTQLDELLNYTLDKHYQAYQIINQYTSPHIRFKELIQTLYEKYQQQVVILVDEYDKPILDNLTETELAISLRDGLKNIYSVIKDCDEYLKFVFLTGVSKFSKVSIFSGLNNLIDITLDSRYATICGYTQSQLLDTFEDQLEGVDLTAVKLWYDGYHFLGESIYNPYDILLFLDQKVFKNYWFETATPSFLIKLLQKRQYFLPRLEQMKASEMLLSHFEIEKLQLETLLFQSGYLTIKGQRQQGARQIFELSYPNLEVKMSLTDFILDYLIEEISEKEVHKIALYDALLEADLDKLKEIFHALFASIPYHWYTKNNLDEYEGYYASVFYCYFAALGIDAKPEDCTNHGRIDLTVKLDDYIYLIEFKVIELDQEKGKAINQIKTKKYYEKYQHTDSQVFLIGVELSRQERNIVHFEWEKLEQEG
jgi:hypothetical protein